MRVRIGCLFIFLIASAPALAQPALAELTLNDLQGQQRSVSELRGNIIVLNFWATWCVPCREEMPLLVSMHNRYAGRGVIVIGASADDESTRAQIPSFLEKLNITFPIWVGANTTHMEKLGLGTGLPATAFIDRDGNIVGLVLGILEKRDIEHRIEYLLGNRKGGPPKPLVDQISNAKGNRSHHPDEHGKEDEHTHGGVALEGASTVPS